MTSLATVSAVACGWSARTCSTATRDAVTRMPAARSRRLTSSTSREMGTASTHHLFWTESREVSVVSHIHAR